MPTSNVTAKPRMGPEPVRVKGTIARDEVRDVRVEHRPEGALGSPSRPRCAPTCRGAAPRGCAS